MDKEGFQLIDAEFQKEMSEAQKRIHDKHHQQFLQKQYVGTREMKAQARAKDRADMQAAIRKEMEEERGKREQLHFGDNSREGWLKIIGEQEKAAVNDNKTNTNETNNPSVKDTFNQEADDKAAKMQDYNNRMKEHAQQKERQREMDIDRSR